jgi:polar amino acid transport system substrate-binding protein
MLPGEYSKMKLMTTSALALLISSNVVFAASHCAAGKTMKDDVLTVATGNPAYFPWVMDDAPESKQGFESAVAYAVANQMGFADEQVEWVRSSFDQAIQPGAKDFDLNLQQYSITPEREEVVDFSAPYYTAAMAVLTRQTVVDNGAEANVASLQGLIWGADANTTAVPMLAEIVKPTKDPLLYGDNADVVEAMKANQIDAALFDLPTALYLGAVVLDDGVVLGQFPPERSQSPDQFGILMEEGNPLKECVDDALAALKADGTLAAIESEWLSEITGVPVIK